MDRERFPGARDHGRGHQDPSGAAEGPDDIEQPASRPQHGEGKGRKQVTDSRLRPSGAQQEEEQGGIGQDGRVHAPFAPRRRPAQPGRHAQQGQRLRADRRLEGEGREVEPPPAGGPHLAEQVRAVPRAGHVPLLEQALPPLRERGQRPGRARGGGDGADGEGVDRPQGDHRGGGESGGAWDRATAIGPRPRALLPRDGVHGEHHGHHAERGDLARGGQAHGHAADRGPDRGRPLAEADRGQDHQAEERGDPAVEGGQRAAGQDRRREAPERVRDQRRARTEPRRRAPEAEPREDGHGDGGQPRAEQVAPHLVQGLRPQHVGGGPVAAGRGQRDRGVHGAQAEREAPLRQRRGLAVEVQVAVSPLQRSRGHVGGLIPHLRLVPRDSREQRALDGGERGRRRPCPASRRGDPQPRPLRPKSRLRPRSRRVPPMVAATLIFEAPDLAS